MTIEKLIEFLNEGEAPQHRVVIEVGLRSLEPYSIRWEHDAVVIEADYQRESEQ